ncbi:MAG TPA: hypothetical protein VN823_21510 [Stellaceae bacterium]|nr:hypothetical protein [Stellaceae bacterium]
MNRICASFAALLALTWASHAEEMFHCPNPGTVVTYGTAGSVTFTGQTGLTCEGRSGNTAFRVILGMIPTDIELEEARAQKLLPLKIGSEIEFTTKMNSSHVLGEGTDSFSMFYVRSTIKVAREEKLATAAGTFDTLVIEHHMDALGHYSGSWMRTYWFAPELGLMVKEKLETHGGMGPDRTFEASWIKVPQ